MPFPDLSDALLLSSFKRGNEKAFASLYQKYYFLAYSVSLEITHSSEDSKEVVNDVFANLWEKQGLIDEGQSFRNYLCRSAKNAAIDLVRQRKDSAELSPENEPHSADLSASDEIAYEELESAISEILDGEDLFIFLSHVERQLTFKAIGKVLGISESAASSAYTRIRLRLSHDPKITSFVTK
jgi:RNA polymerase sigma factor (sigma-70 family)